MTYDELMETLRICSVGTSTDCDACRLHGSHDCHTIMARAALDVLNTKNQPFGQRQMALKTVEMALDKGGYSVTVAPDGEVRMMPWDSTPWISMRDEQPDHDGKYLTFHGLLKDWFKGENPNVMISICNWYKCKGGWYSLTYEKPIKTVTHWMELPATPGGCGCDEAD